MPIIPKYSELQSMPDSELIEMYDKAAEHTVVGTSFFLEEIMRRHQTTVIEESLSIAEKVKDINESILSLTRRVWGLTIVIGVLTFVNVICAIVSAWMRK